MTTTEEAEREAERLRLEKELADLTALASARKAKREAEVAAQRERERKAALNVQDQPLYGFVPVGTIMDDALRMVRCGTNVFLAGDPSSGKSTLVETLAAMCGQELVTVIGSKAMDPMALFGRGRLQDGNTYDEEGPVVRAMKNGGWLFLDEMNGFPDASQLALNSVCDYRRIAYEPTVMLAPIKAHPKFRVFGAANIGSQYIGTGKISPALASRFSALEAIAPDERTMSRLLIGAGISNPSPVAATPVDMAPPESFAMKPEEARKVANFIARANARGEKLPRFGVRNGYAIARHRAAGMTLARAAECEVLMLTLDNKTDRMALMEMVRLNL